MHPEHNAALYCARRLQKLVLRGNLFELYAQECILKILLNSELNSVDASMTIF